MKSRQTIVIRLCLIPVLFIFFKCAYAWGLVQRYGDFLLLVFVAAPFLIDMCIKYYRRRKDG